MDAEKTMLQKMISMLIEADNALNKTKSEPEASQDTPKAPLFDETPEPIFGSDKSKQTINLHVSEAELVEVEKAFDQYFERFNRKPISNHGLMLIIMRDFCIHWKDRPMVEAWSKSASNHFKRAKRKEKHG